MPEELFVELLESVKQGAAIMKGKAKPSRSIEFPESEVRKIREQYGLLKAIVRAGYAEPRSA